MEEDGAGSCFDNFIYFYEVVKYFINGRGR